MNLFKNGVGRPSNETIRKRRIFYVAIVFAIILVLGLGTYLLTNINSSSKLKGALTFEQLELTFKSNCYHSANGFDGKKSLFLPCGNSDSARINLSVNNKSRTAKYYRVYVHKVNRTEDKISSGTLESKSSCFKLNGSSSNLYTFDVKVDKTWPIKRVVAKGFASEDLCTNDSYGIDNDDNSVSKHAAVYKSSGNDIYNNDTYDVAYYQKDKNVSGGREIVKKGFDTYVREPNFSSNDLAKLNKKEITGWVATCSGHSTSMKYGYNKKNNLGWHESTDVKKEYVFKLGDKLPKLSSSCSDTLQLYGKIKTTLQFKVKYNANGGTGSMSDQKIFYGVSTRLKNNKFTRSGYKFAGWVAVRNNDRYTYGYDSNGKAGWYEKPDKKYVYTNKQKVSKTVIAGQTVTMYAQWTR